MNIQDFEQPMRDTFRLLYESNQFKEVPSKDKSYVVTRYETTHENFNIVFERTEDARSGHSYTNDAIIFKDQDKKELYRLNSLRAQPLFEVPYSKVYINVHNKSLENKDEIVQLLNATPVESLLKKVSAQSQALVEENKPSRIPEGESVSDIVARMEALRSGTKNTVQRNFKDM